MNQEVIVALGVCLCLPFPIAATIWALHGKAAILTPRFRSLLVGVAFAILGGLYLFVQTPR